MPYPNYPGKYESEPVFTPSRFIEYAKSTGKYKFEYSRRIILTYSKSLLEYIAQTYDHTAADFQGRLLLLEKYPVGVIGDIGIGGPMTATTVEELGELGTMEFIIIGTSGAISPDMAIGDVAVIEKAIRDEGVSHHYIPSQKWIKASSSLTNQLAKGMETEDILYTKGSSWTIDTPYQETEAEVLQYQKEEVNYSSTIIAQS